ncbi:SRPBCC domain-containing protein [Leptospira sp. FAT2]|uniref:SRPBCC domain-containing protein n=1 Tax=Leptospira sanjuanensis TaxID=2879643 RepID=UPI001EE90143|nr:SRPBCC domain-containing protein [Leptospira sanjuanensis]MCG6166973.1 SRPBCC domain-containing protein [Leptospira sanjuanensis]MCG6192428.1 SRPBCC domain-containing protein [Leptospira sanjuanensis]
MTNRTKDELVITRLFNAPREAVFDAWTNPEQVMKWWGPKNFTTPYCKMDFRVGGRYVFCMRAPDGNEFWSTGEYKEIVRPEKIVKTDSFADSNGNPVPASHYGIEGEWPEVLLISLLFEDQQGKTKFTLRHTGIPGAEVSEMTGASWNESLDKLEAILK